MNIAHPGTLQSDMPPTVPLHETPNESRIRSLAPWQATCVVVLAFLLALPLLFVPGLLASRTALGAFGTTVMTGSVGVCGALVGFVLLARALNVSPRVFFLDWPTRQSLRWTLVTVCLIVVICFTAYRTGGVVVPQTGYTPKELLLRVLAAIAVGLWTGIVEEFLLRGVVLSVIGHHWHWPGAIIVSAIVFGILHQGGGDTTTAAILYVLLTSVAGVFFGILVVVTGNVWNAVAVHATWNAGFAGYLVGFNVTAEPLPVIVLLGDAHWLLGAGGSAPAESPLAIILFVVLLAAFLLRTSTTIAHDSP